MSKPLNSHFFKDVLKLATGTSVAQVIGIVLTPVLARIFPPEAYGVAAVYASVISIFGVLACLRYEQAIVLPENDEDAVNLFGLSIVSAFAVAVFTIPLIWLAGPYLVKSEKLSILGGFIWLVPISVFLYGLNLALEYWGTRKKQYTHLSIARLSASLTTNFGMLGSGTLASPTGGAMIASSIAGQGTTSLVLGNWIRRSDGSFIWAHLSLARMFTGAKRYKKFPLFNGWAGLLNIVSWQLPVLMLTAYFSPEIVGYYALGFRIIQMPMSLIGGAVTQVFHQSAAQAYTDGTLPELVESLVRKMIHISVFPTIILLIAAKDIYIVAFGMEWAEAGVYTQILSVWGFVWFISGPLNTLFGVLELQEEGLRAQIVIFVSRVIALVLGVWLKDARLTLLLFAASGVFAYGNYVYKVHKYAGASWHEGLKTLGRSVVKSMPFVLALGSIKYFIQSPLIIVLFAILIGVFHLVVYRSDYSLQFSS